MEVIELGNTIINNKPRVVWSTGKARAAVAEVWKHMYVCGVWNENYAIVLMIHSHTIFTQN